MQVRVERLTDEQIADLPNVPVELIPAPPEGFQIIDPHIVESNDRYLIIEYELTQAAP